MILSVAVYNGAEAAERLNRVSDPEAFLNILRAVLEYYYSGYEPHSQLAAFTAVVDGRGFEMIASFAAAYAERMDDDLDFLAGTILIVFEDDIDINIESGSAAAGTVGELTLDDIREELADFPGEVETLSELGDGVETFATVDLPLEMTVEQAIEEYEQSDLVKFAQPVFVYEIMDAVRPNDPIVNAPWQTYYGYLDRMGIFDAWTLLSELPGREKVRVAVVDQQIDMTHEDLTGRLLNDLAVNIQYVGDKATYMPSLYPAGVHGTHVAGLIAANSNNGKGGVGVAAGYDNSIVEILPINVFPWNSSSNSYGNTNTVCVAEAVNYAVSQGAQVINLSLGGRQEDTIFKAMVDLAVSEGVTVVVAAGNFGDTGPVYPSDWDSVISVINVMHSTAYGSTFPGTMIPWAIGSNPRNPGSSYGAQKNISAPGTFVWSSVPPGQEASITPGAGAYYNRGYDVLNGTSMAAPIVAGVAAMVLYVNPNLAPAEVAQILYDTATDVNTPGFDIHTANGIVNAKDAVDEGIIKPFEINPFHISLKWSGDAGTLYNVYRRAAGDSAPVKITTTPQAANAYDDYDISPAATYYYSVSKVIDGIEGVPGGECVVTTASVQAPASLTLAIAGQFKAKATWGAVNISGLTTSYRLERKLDGAADSTYTTIVDAAAGTSFVDENVEHAVAYIYRVTPYWFVNGVQREGASKTLSAPFVPYFALPAPAGFKAAAIRPTGADLTWTRIPGAAGYELYFSGETYEIEDLNPGDPNSTANNPVKKTIDGLDPNQTYFALVRAYWEYQTTNSLGEPVAVVEYGPYSAGVNVKTTGPAPGGFTASNVTSSSARLTWNQITGASGYIVYRTGVSSPNSAAFEEIGSLTPAQYSANSGYFDGTVMPGVSVKYNVRAYWDGDTTKTGSVSAAVTVIPPGFAPGGVKAAANGPTSLTATWDLAAGVNAVAGAGGAAVSSYNVYLYGKDGSGKFEIIDNESISRTAPRSWQFTGLDPAGQYQVRVAAVYDIGPNPNAVLYPSWVRYREGPLSAIASAKTTAPAPGGIKASNVTAWGACLTWNPIADASGYIVYRTGVSAPDSSVFEEIGSLTPAQYADNGGYFDGTLSPGVSVRYNVRAYWGGDTAKIGGASAAATVKPPGAVPGGLKAAVNGPTSLTATWNAVAGIGGAAVSSYNVYLYEKDSNGKFTEIDSETIGAAAVKRWQFTGLDPATQYQVRVAAEYDVGTNPNVLLYPAWNQFRDGALSAIANVKTTGPAPGGIKAGNVTAWGARLTWNPVAGASGYVVYRTGVSAPGSTVFEEIGSLTPSEYTANGGYLDGSVSPGVSVRYNVRAYWGDESKTGNASGAATIKPPGSVPGGIKAAVNGPTSLTATWNAAAGVAGAAVYSYNVYLFVKGSNGKFTQIDSEEIDAAAPRTWQFTGLNPSSQYQVRVAAVYDVGANPDTELYSFWLQTREGRLSAVANAKTPGPAPGALKAGNVTAWGARLTWNPVAGASGYVVYRTGVSAPGSTAYEAIGSLTPAQYAVNGGYLDGTLNPGVSVKYNVRAYWDDDTAKTGSVSAAATVKPPGAAPGGLKTAVNGPTSLTATWNAVSDVPGAAVSSYNVYLYAKDSSGRFVSIDNEEIDSAAARAWQFTGLDQGTQYQVRVTAVYDVGTNPDAGLYPAWDQYREGPLSSIANAKTLGTAAR